MVHNNIKALLENFSRVAIQKDLCLSLESTPYGVDSAIFRWLPNSVVQNTPFPKGSWTPTDPKNGTLELNMLEKAQKMYLSQALECFIEEVKNNTFFYGGYFHKIIFLEETDDQGSALKLLCELGNWDRISLTLFKVKANNRFFIQNLFWYTKT